MELYLIYALGAVSGLLVLFVLILSSRLSKLTRRYREFMAGGSGVSLEGTLSTIQTQQSHVLEELSESRRRLALVEASLGSSIRSVGVVRFNAFQDTGSDLSFAVAYLDGNRNGVVMSSIFGRDESRMYAKPLENGKSAYQLSTEEQEAIVRAIVKMEAVADAYPPIKVK